jgi:hypothetical protein
MFLEMKPAEKRLLEHSKKGEPLEISKERPTEKTADNEIRGEFLRALILSNNQEIEENGKKYVLRIILSGINLQGAYISGIFDLSFCNTNLFLFFENSVFENEINLMYSKIGLLYFLASKLKEIKGYGLICVNDIVFIKSEVKGELNFGISQIKNLIFIDGNISNQDGNALNCLSAIIKEIIQISQSEIEGNLILSLAKIDNLLTISNLNIIGNIEFEATETNTLNIEGSRFWEQEKLKEFKFDGFKYNHLSVIDLNSETLINLLNKMPEFKPQPYKQLAKVLRNMGHNNESDDIMIKYNEELRKKDFVTCNRLFISILKWIYGFTSGYGYKPMRVLGTMFIVWFLCSLFYWNASKVAVFAPNNPLVFQKKDCYQCNVNSDGTPLLDIFSWDKYDSTNNWVLNENLDGEYTTFNPFMYSLDVILPIVDLQVEKDWGQYIAMKDGTLNDFTRWLMWFEILFGWIYSLILVAILSGLAKNEKD